jgi:hypothetical protein
MEARLLLVSVRKEYLIEMEVLMLSSGQNFSLPGSTSVQCEPYKVGIPHLRSREAC